jgi:nicotinate-nucleotide adenylyltransferase
MTPAPALGLFGGTFDPIHAAHLRMAQAFRTELQLDEVRLIPAGQPYHRQHGPHASPAQRLDMVRLAIAGLPGLRVDAREVQRNKPAYTIDTLEEIRAEIGPDQVLWWLIGGDSLASLHTWRRWTELFALANIAVALRPGFDETRLPAAVRTQWQHAKSLIFQMARLPVQCAPWPCLHWMSRPPGYASACTAAPTSAPAQRTGTGYIRQHQLYL